MKHDVFISYSRGDLEAVSSIKEELQDIGFSCWMDLEGIESGSEEFTEPIARAIDGSTAVFFFLSEASQKSRWSLNELRLARTKRKHLVFVRINNDLMQDRFVLEFGGTDVIDWRVAPQREKCLKDLWKWTGREPSTPEPGGQPINGRKRNKLNLRSFVQGVVSTVSVLILLLFALLALFAVFAPNTSRKISSQLEQLFP